MEDHTDKEKHNAYTLTHTYAQKDRLRPNPASLPDHTLADIGLTLVAGYRVRNEILSNYYEAPHHHMGR